MNMHRPFHVCRHVCDWVTALFFSNLSNLAALCGLFCIHLAPKTPVCCTEVPEVLFDLIARGSGSQYNLESWNHWEYRFSVLAVRRFFVVIVWCTWCLSLLWMLMVLEGIFAPLAPQICFAIAFLLFWSSDLWGHSKGRMDGSEHQGSHWVEEWNSSRRTTIGLGQLGKKWCCWRCYFICFYFLLVSPVFSLVFQNLLWFFFDVFVLFASGYQELKDNHCLKASKSLTLLRRSPEEAAQNLGQPTATTVLCGITWLFNPNMLRTFGNCFVFCQFPSVKAQLLQRLRKSASEKAPRLLRAAPKVLRADREAGLEWWNNQKTPEEWRREREEHNVFNRSATDPSQY